jgi:signal transduction histidine kinase
LAGKLDDNTGDYLERMENAAVRMQAMIKGLLDLSRVTTGDDAFTRVDLNRVIQEVISDLEPRILSTRGEVIADTLPEVSGDYLQIRQLIQNLTSNALKFHKEGIPPVVRITGEVLSINDYQLIQIIVEDNGIGFDAGSAELIFHPFVRLHGRSKYEGSGIGLAICRKIAERHGGSITASSKQGEGSKFIITLPVKGESGLTNVQEHKNVVQLRSPAN